METSRINIITLIVCIIVQLSSCTNNSKFYANNSTNFKQIKLFYTDGSFYSFHISIDSNGNYKKFFKSKEDIGLLSDSIFLKLDESINNITADTTIKTNEGICCDCKTIVLKVVREQDSLEIIQYGAAKWEIDTKLEKLVLLCKEL
jgi:hypothetical protein